MSILETMNECSSRARRTLRRLGKSYHDTRTQSSYLISIFFFFKELEAYASVISAFRAQGQLTRDKKSSLEVLCKSLGQVPSPPLTPHGVKYCYFNVEFQLSGIVQRFGEQSMMKICPWLLAGMCWTEFRFISTAAVCCPLFLASLVWRLTGHGAGRDRNSPLSTRGVQPTTRALLVPKCWLPLSVLVPSCPYKPQEQLKSLIAGKLTT